MSSLAVSLFHARFLSFSDPGLHRDSVLAPPILTPTAGYVGVPQGEEELESDSKIFGAEKIRSYISALKLQILRAEFDSYFLHQVKSISYPKRYPHHPLRLTYL